MTAIHSPAPDEVPSLTNCFPIKTTNKASRRPTYLHNVVVDFHARAFHDTKVSLQVAPANVAVRLGVVGGPVEEDPSPGVVLYQVVDDQRTGRHGGDERSKPQACVLPWLPTFRKKAVVETQIDLTT